MAAPNTKQLIAESKDYLSLKAASSWASNYMRRPVTVANISYLVQYGRLKRYGTQQQAVLSLAELRDYYSDLKRVAEEPKTDGVDWNLSFSQYREAERTKHVHRLHPYKGKFIPQLVEYFLTIKEHGRQLFNPGEVLLDPFCGSGTTLVQANECGMHAIGVDVSGFNVLISNAKLGRYDLAKSLAAGNKITQLLQDFQRQQKNLEFEHKLVELLASYNSKYCNGPDYRVKVRQKDFAEKSYVAAKEQALIADYNQLVAKYKIQLLQQERESFLGKWFLLPVKQEIDFVFNQLKRSDDKNVRTILALVLSRTLRSCRATTHADLGTLKEPVLVPYYCRKHYKFCRPLFSISSWWQRYLADTIKRLGQFAELRTDTQQLALTGDSRELDLAKGLAKSNPLLAGVAAKQGIKGIFSSPPYVGLIDYHEQHAYSYELFGIERRDELEIGPLLRGQGRQARDDYKNSIIAVLRNCVRFLQRDYEVFIVANDKYNLYPDIARAAGMKIVRTYKRPVLNRVEKDRGNIYHEEIFHLRSNV